MDLQGTNVAAGIVPFTEEDGYATHQAKYGKGGLRTAANRAERFALPKDRRELYMEVTDADTGIKWRLNNGLDSEVTTDSDWDTAPGSGDMQKAEYAPSKIPGTVDYALEIATETQNRIIYVDQVNGKDDDPAYDGSSWEKAFKTGPRMLRSIKRNCPVQISVLFSDGDHDWSGLTEPIFYIFGKTGGINLLGNMTLFKHVRSDGNGLRYSEADLHYYQFTEVDDSGLNPVTLNLPKDSIKFLYSINGGPAAGNAQYRNARANGCCVGSRIVTNDTNKLTPVEATGNNGMVQIMKSTTTFINLRPDYLSCQTIDLNNIWHTDIFIPGFAVLDCNIEVPNTFTKTGVPSNQSFLHFAFQNISLENCHLYAKGASDEYSYPISFENSYIHGCSIYRDNYNASYPYAIWVGNTDERLIKVLSLHIEGNFVYAIYGGSSPSSLYSSQRNRSELVGFQINIIRTSTPLISGSNTYLRGISVFGGNITKLIYKDIFVKNMGSFGISLTGSNFNAMKVKIRRLFVIKVKPETNLPVISSTLPDFYVATFTYARGELNTEETLGQYDIDFDMSFDIIHGLDASSALIAFSETGTNLGRLLKSAKLNLQTQIYYNLDGSISNVRIPLICGFSYNQIVLTASQEVAVPLLCAAAHKGITGEIVTSDMKIARFTFLLNRLSLTDRTYSFINDGTTDAELEITPVVPANGTEVLVWKFYEVKIKNTGSTKKQITLHTEVIPVTPNTP